MMSMREIKNINSKNIRHMKYRKLPKPKRSIQHAVNKPYQHEYSNGNYSHDIYYSIKPSVIAWTYILNILLFSIPAYLLHAAMWIVDTASKIILPNEYVTPNSGIQLLLIVYVVCIGFGIRKANDHMAYFNVSMLVSKFDINRLVLHAMLDAQNEYPSNNEFIVMEHYRKKFNKYSLFPSVRELATEEQLYNVAMNNPSETAREYAETRRKRLNIKEKTAEHVAAKMIADIKQEKFGGRNEYDLMVAQYKYRTIPAIRNIIEEVQKQKP